MEENITKPTIFLNLPHISENIEATAFFNFSSVNLKLLKLYCLQHCDKLKYFTLCMCSLVCIDASACLHIYYDWSVQKISITVLRKDHVIFKVYVSVYHDFNAWAHTRIFFLLEADLERLWWVL